MGEVSGQMLPFRVGTLNVQSGQPERFNLLSAPQTFGRLCDCCIGFFGCLCLHQWVGCVPMRGPVAELSCLMRFDVSGAAGVLP